ncbi:hypothetical protein L7F22_060289 [Adiantum nelumboides]|nr:hypothetical protein [Adiantum nelumboides]
MVGHVGGAGQKLHDALAKEVRNAVQEEGGGAVTVAALRKMELARSIVYKSLRMSPPVSYQYARAKEDITVESHDARYEIKKGELIGECQPVATRDPRVFKDAENFVAERFMGEEGKKLLKFCFCFLVKIDFVLVSFTVLFSEYWISVLYLVRDIDSVTVIGSGLVTAQSLVSGLLLSKLVSGSGFGLVSFLVLDWLLDSAGQCRLVSVSVSGSDQCRFRTFGWTQGSATQDPHIAASDSFSDFDVMEGYPMQQHPESCSQDMHALGQQPGISMFSRLKETLSRATRSEHVTNEINEGGGEVDSPFTSQIDPVLSESAHVSTPTTTPIGLSKLTPSETLLPDGRSLAEVQEVERYILAAREKKIESLRKAEQRRATLAKAPMTSTNPLQSPELTTLTSQPIGSHIASGSKDTPNTSILNGVFLNENWEYNLQTEKLTDLYTSYTYHVGWLDVIQATSNSTSVDEQQRMICDVIHSIVQIER